MSREGGGAIRKVAITTVLSFSLASAARGAVIYADADAAGANDGSSWTDAYTDLQSPLAVAGSSDEIWVAEGTYKPTSGTDRTISFELVEGVALYGGFVGTESSRGERDWEAHETILNGDLNGDDDPAYQLSDPLRNNGENSYHVVVGASDATIDGFTVTQGNSANGGGMYNEGLTGLTVANCVFSANKASLGGGGMYNENVTGVTIRDCVFSANADIAYGGGGLLNSYYCSPTIINCTFSGNTASQGGGIYNEMESCPYVSGCTFTENLADWCGGGICSDSSSPSVSGCTFSGNTGDFGGGGMYNFDNSSPVVTNCVFSGNLANNDGGAGGGGVCNVFYSSPVLTNCSFSGNASDLWGGGIANLDSSSSVTNCILWGDSAPVGAEVFYAGASSCAVTHSDVAQVGGFSDQGGNINADPLFVSAATDDLHLQAGSPCIDAADGDAAPVTDIEGNFRQDEPGVANTGIGTPPYADMGAYEFESAGGESMTVLSPNGGEGWDAGTQEQVSWASAGGTVTNVRIEFSRDGGTSWGYIDGGSPVANAGSFTWDVVGPASADCLVRVTDASDGTPIDKSDAVFTIREVIILTLTQSAATEGDGTLSIGTVSIPTALSSPLTVTLSSDDTTEATVPAEVTIPAGLASVDFDVTVLDDMVIDGDEAATITATATAYVPGNDSLLVQDNEPSTITVALPANATEGDGTLAGQGSVALPAVCETELVVDLASSDETELTVPATVTIPQGDTSATFDLTVIDDGEIDGTQNATVTPTLAGWTCTADSMDVLDNESQTITVTLPTSATEGDGVLVGQGIVSIAGTWATDLVIDLASGDTSELIVPATVTVLQGNTSATFDPTVETDGTHDGTQTVTVTASSAGWTGSSADIEILDIDPAQPDGGGCASGVPAAALAFCVLIPYLALRSRQRPRSMVRR